MHHVEGLDIGLFLESKDLVFQLANRLGLLETKTLSCLFEAADHGRRTTEQNLDIVGRLGQVFLKSAVSNE